MVHCEAIIEDERLVKNLCYCVKIIGGTPVVNGNTVSVNYEGKPDKVIALFEQFSDHTISMKKEP